MISGAIAVVGLGVALVAGARHGQELAERLEEIGRSAVAEQRLPGLALQVARGDEVMLARGWGYADAARANVEGVDVVRDASAALEPLAAIALLRLVEQGKLTLDDELSLHIAELAHERRHVRVGQLLAHTSGLASYVDYLRAPGHEIALPALVAWLAEQPLDAEPATCFAYSPSNALLAALLVAKHGEQSLADALREWVIEPAGLARTELVLRGPEELSRAALAAAPASIWLGVGGLRTTLADLAALPRALAERDLVGASGWRAASEPLLLADGSESPHTLVFSRTLLAQHACLSFGGRSASGGQVRVDWYPELDLVVALATRDDDAPLATIAQRVARVVLDLPPPEMLDLPLARERRAVYVGGYYIGCTRIGIEERGESLVFASPYQEPFRLKYQGRHTFVSADDAEVRLDFTVEEGRAEAFRLTVRGTATLARRVE